AACDGQSPENPGRADGERRHRGDSAPTPTTRVNGSDEAKMPGTYIGETCAGTARNVPADTTLTRYTYSERPSSKLSWKNTVRWSRYSTFEPHRHRTESGRSSGYAVVSCTASTPAGSGSSSMR